MNKENINEQGTACPLCKGEMFELDNGHYRCVCTSKIYDKTTGKWFELKTPLERIRMMNPGKKIPSGAELALKYGSNVH